MKIIDTLITNYRMTVKQGFALCSLMLLLVTASCNSAKNTELAEQGASIFHSQLNAEQYHAIYEPADKEFRNAMSETDFVALLQAIHRKLGNFQKSKLQSSQVSWIAGKERS